MARLKKHQHTVTRTLLRGFCDSRGMVTMWRRNGLVRDVHINDAAVRKSFYRFHDDTGQSSDAVEDWLDKRVENPVGPVLKRIREGGQLSPADRPALSRFVVAGLLRTATVAAYMRQIDEHIGPILLASNALARQGMDPSLMNSRDLQAVREAAERVWGRLTRDDPKSRLRTIARKFDELVLEVTDWTWTVEVAAEDRLIVSDAPVGTFQSDPVGWHGLLPAGSPLMVPISPRHLLIAEKNPVAPQQTATLDPQLADLVNRRIAREADDAIFSRPGVSWPTGLVLARRSPALPAPTVTWSRSGSGRPPSFPTMYPAVDDESVRELLAALDAEDRVD